MKFKSHDHGSGIYPRCPRGSGGRNDVPSCYAQAKIENFRSAPSGRLLTVVVDQTTPLTPDLQKTAWGHIKRFIQPGDKLRLCSFSAYLEGHYTRLQFAGELEKTSRSGRTRRCTDDGQPKVRCLPEGSVCCVVPTFRKGFSNAMGKSSSDIPRSEILFSLKSIGDDIKNAEGVDGGSSC